MQLLNQEAHRTATAHQAASAAPCLRVLDGVLAGQLRAVAAPPAGGDDTAEERDDAGGEEGACSEQGARGTPAGSRHHQGV